VGDYLFLIIALVVVFVAALAGLVTTRFRSRKDLPDLPQGDGDVLAPPEPGVGEDAETPRDSERRTVEDTQLPADLEPALPEAEPAPALERPESTAGRLVRLRQRLARSQGGLGRGLLALL